MKFNSRLSIAIITVLVLAFGVAAVADYGFSGKNNLTASVNTADMQNAKTMGQDSGSKACPVQDQERPRVLRQCGPAIPAKDFGKSSCSDKSKASKDCAPGDCSDKASKDCAPGDCSDKASKDCAPGDCSGSDPMACAPGDCSPKKSDQCPVTGKAQESSETTI